MTRLGFARAILLSSATISGIAHAQTIATTPEAAQSDRASATAATGGGAQADRTTPADAVQDIVVTAQRRPELLQNVPLSVTAVSGATLKNRVINDLAQLSIAAPSLQITTDNNFAVRGVGTTAFSSSIESSVAYAQDEVNLTNPGLISDFFDVDQVEVLNGPQGLLFGRNASAGLLNITTARPKLGSYGGSLDFEGDYRDTAPGDSSGVIVRPTINVPLGDAVAIRLSGLYTYQDPLTSFVGPVGGRNDLEQRRYALRGKFLFQPNDRFSLYVIGDVGHEEGVQGLFDLTFRQLGVGSVNAAPLASVGIVPSDTNTTIAGEGGYYRNLSRRGVQAKVSYVLDGGIEISDIAAWKSFDRTQQLDVDGTSLNGASVNVNRFGFDQYTNELRIALPADARLSGQAGLYYFRADFDSQGQIAGNNYLPSFVLSGFPFCVGAVAVPGARPPVCSTRNSYFLGYDTSSQQRNESHAAFGQLTYKLTDGLQLIAGGRVTHDAIRLALVQTQDRYFVPLNPSYVGGNRFRNTNFSWKAGAQYNFDPSLMVYGFYGRGYKGPGFNGTAPTSLGPEVVRSETNRNVEIGAKSTWLDRRLTINVSAFHSDFRNYQSQALDVATATFIIQNAAKVRSQGVEGQLVARPFRGFTINASATYVDSKFGNYPGAPCYPTQGCRTFNGDGLRLPLAPKLTTTAQAIYEFAGGGEVNPYVEANYYHRSPIRYDVAPSPGTVFGDANVVGASIGIRGEVWRAAVFCKNCSDQRVPVSIGVDPGDAFSNVLSYNQRFGLNSFRTLGVQLGYSF